MKSVNPYVYFNGNTKEAFQFYQSVFGGELSLMTFRDFGDNDMGVAPENLDMVAHASIPLSSEHVLMGTDTTDESFTIGNNTYITLETDTQEEANDLFNKLSNGGKVVMPLEETEWAESYGIVVDKFGVQWMVTFTGSKQF